MAAGSAACPDDPLGPGRWSAPPGPDRWRGILDEAIISFSGWRRVFAVSGDPESLRPEVDPAAALFAAAAGYVFGRRLAQTGPAPAVAAVALDTRPTSAAAGCAVIRGLLAAGAQVRFPGIAPTPEAMAFIALEPGLDGLIIVTASHNPPGWNGVKFSAGDGRVLPRDRAQALEESLHELVRDPAGLEAFYTSLRNVDPAALTAVYAHSAAQKRRSLTAYRRHAARELTAEASASGRASVLEQLHRSLERRPLGVVAELNGSARTVSIDREFLDGLGLKVRAVNYVPGRIAHAILPEGEALHPACRVLELAALEDHAFELGYVPDCDGDRGNVVVLDPQGVARPLEAQEVFALAVTAEL
ncbi:phosphatidylglycerol lysyltransferase, partial [bacterium]|nr:phosphatidylglycerol lysyltransferase [bacterium]